MNKSQVIGTKRIVVVGIFSAICFVLQFIGSMVGLKVSGFLEVEISDLPALIISMAYGPLAGVLTEFVKNLLHCTVTSTGFVGELANFVVNGTFCLVAGLIYKHKKTFKNAVFALMAGVISMAVIGIFSNMFIMLPLYMPDAPFSTTFNLVMTTIVPFNLVRGFVLVILTALVYKRISKVIK